MRASLFFTTFVLLSSGLLAQTAYRLSASSNPPRIYEGDGTLPFGFATGMQASIFNNLDYDLDGVLDIVVTDKNTGGSLVFIGNGDSIQPDYTYLSGADDVLPRSGKFLKIRDYNNDGWPDIFTGTHSVRLYENVGNKDDGHRFEIKKYTVPYLRDNKAEPIKIADGDTPDFVDVDNDGDLDILAFNETGDLVWYYQNISTDIDEPKFEIRSECWGSFQEEGLNNNIILGRSCENRQFKTGQHPGSKLLAYDEENDGDIDLLISDLAYPNVVKLKNGRVEEKHSIDTMTSQVDKYPDYDAKIDVPYFPLLSLCDVNFDGAQDLIASSSSASPVSNGLIWMYENTKQKGYRFSLKEKSFLQSGMLDLGIHTIPALYDMDGDGDHDLVVGAINHIDKDPTKEQESEVWLFENIGNDKRPIYESAEASIRNKNGAEVFMSPAFGDIDNDGVADLVVGTGSGFVLVFKNSAKKGEPMILNQVKDIDVKLINAQPFVYDYDNDETADLIVGSENGRIAYFKGKGNLDFELITEEFGQIKTGAEFYTYTRDGEGNKIDSTKRYSPVGASRPVLLDFDKNGKVDLLCGSAWGRLYFYPDISDKPENTFKRDVNIYRSNILLSNYNKVFGQYITPYPIQIDGDDHASVILGHSLGGLEFLQGGMAPVSVPEPSSEKLHFSIYPNPANESITVKGKFQTATLRVYDMQGTQVQVVRKVQANNSLDITNLADGLYMVQAESQNARSSKRLLILR